MSLPGYRTGLIADRLSYKIWGKAQSNQLIYLVAAAVVLWCCLERFAARILLKKTLSLGL